MIGGKREAVHGTCFVETMKSFTVWSACVLWIRTFILLKCNQSVNDLILFELNLPLVGFYRGESVQ